jgi:hypothetical protein
MEPLFIEPGGTAVELRDPYDQTRGDHSGVQRRIAPLEELVDLVSSFGLNAQSVPHQRKGYGMVMAVK